MMSKKEFEKLSPKEKGYAVYMAGCRDDQPHIPETYIPNSEEKEEYDEGQFAGVLEAMEGGG